MQDAPSSSTVAANLSRKSFRTKAWRELTTPASIPGAKKWVYFVGPRYIQIAPDVRISSNQFRCK